MKRTLLCLLAALLVLSAAGCGGNETETEPIQQEIAAVPENNEPAETTRAEIKDGLPDNMDLNGETVHFIVVYECAKYDALGENGGDVVFDAVYNRNLKVEERLNTKLDYYVYGTAYEHDAMAKVISSSIMAGTDEYNVVMQRGPQAFSMSLQGMYMDLNNNAYIDTTKPWWWSDTIADISINTDKMYFLTGDISLSTFLFSTSCYFNKNMMADYSFDVDTLYKTVQDGKWTYDVWEEYCSVVYEDVDGDGKASEADKYAFSGVNPTYFSRSAGLTFIERDAEGYPVLALNNEKNIAYLETLNRILHDTRYTFSSIASDGGTIAKYFTSGKNLFFMGRLVWVTGIYAENLRDMEDPYGIIPYPKFAEEDQYMAGIGTSGNHIAVPVTCVNFDAASMVIEAMCAENYRTVFPAMYETALKTRYSDTNIDSQMIDLIHDSVYNDFATMSGLDILIDGLVIADKADFASAYASSESRIQKSLTTMVESYKAIE